jgi:hypothetical protein
MKKIVMVQMEDTEQDTLRRLTMFGSVLGVDADNRPRFGRRLRNVMSEDGATAVQLADMRSLLAELRDVFVPQTDPDWWRNLGATGRREAIEGLAAGRANDVEAILHADVLLAQAESLC